MLPSGNFPCRKVPVKSRFSGGGILCRINKLPNLRALLLEVGQMLLANFLVDLELLLGAAFFAGANIRLPQPVVSVGQIGIEFQRALILRNRFCIFILDRKSTRLNSSHEWISYAVFCLKKKKV